MEEIKTHPVGEKKALEITGSICVIAPLEKEKRKDKIKKAETVMKEYKAMDTISYKDLTEGVVIKVSDTEQSR